jgi:hypothetical protein
MQRGPGWRGEAVLGQEGFSGMRLKMLTDR